MIKKFLLLFTNLAFTIFVCVNFFIEQNFYIHIIISAIFLILNLYLFASILSKYNHKSWILSTLLIFGIITIPGSITYYLYQINSFVLCSLAVLIFALSTFFWFKNEYPLLKLKIPRLKLTFIEFLTMISYLTFIGFIIFILIKSRSDIAVRTPWALIDKRIFVLYFTSTFILIIFFWQTKLASFWKKVFLSIHFFISFCITLIVYKIVFGYDPFIHQKTIEIISQNGSIDPKPLYYLGQYTLEVFFHKLLLIPIDWIDRLLIPVLAAVSLPSIISFSIKKINPIAVLIFLAIPYSFLTFTTPQNLTFFFSLIIIFLAYRFIVYENISWLWLGLLSLIILTIHPLSGLPMLLYSIALLIFKKKSNNPISKIAKILYLILSAIIIPLAFILLNLTRGYQINLQFNWATIAFNFSSFFQSLFYLKNNFRQIYDLIYFYGLNIKLFIIIFIAVFLILLWKKGSQMFGNKTKKQTKHLAAFSIASFIILAVNYLILKNFFVFEELIYYERADYALRLVTLMFFFLFPLILIFASKLIISINKRKIIFISAFVLLSLIISASFYLSYPRYDNVQASRALNVSKYDFKAVQYIENNESLPYIVLANQNTSVAAVKLYGFDPVYNSYFYYPIPTGNELYQIFLQMVNDQPKLEYINEARQLTRINTVYFVLPKYWNNFNQIKSAAEQIAIEHHSIDDQIEIFKF